MVPLSCEPVLRFSLQPPGLELGCNLYSNPDMPSTAASLFLLLICLFCPLLLDVLSGKAGQALQPEDQHELDPYDAHTERQSAQHH